MSGRSLDASNNSLASLNESLRLSNMQQAASGPMRRNDSTAEARRSGSIGNASDGKASTLVGHSKCVSAVAWHPFDPILASASEDGTVKIWGAEDGVCKATLEGHKGAVWDCMFGPEGQFLVSCSEDRSLKIWDLENVPVVSTTLRGADGSRTRRHGRSWGCPIAGQLVLGRFRGH